MSIYTKYIHIIAHLIGRQVGLSVDTYCEKLRGCIFLLFAITPLTSRVRRRHHCTAHISIWAIVMICVQPSIVLPDFLNHRHSRSLSLLISVLLIKLYAFISSTFMFMLVVVHVHPHNEMFSQRTRIEEIQSLDFHPHVGHDCMASRLGELSNVLHRPR